MPVNDNAGSPWACHCPQSVQMIYLDHAATSLPRHPDAIAAATEAMSRANPGRGLHRAQSAALGEVARAREVLAALVGLPIVAFTAGCTMSVNLALLGLRPRPRQVATDPLIHNAVRRPLHALRTETWTLPADPEGRVDVARAREAWVEGTDLVVVTHGSNVTGVVQPLSEICEVARARGARVLVDAAQTVGVIDDLDLSCADAVAFGGHKGLRALPGVGVLALREDAPIDAVISGGTGSDARQPDMPRDLPARLEAGTINLPGILALSAAAEARRRAPWDWRAAGQALRDAVQAAGVQPIGTGELPVVSVRLANVGPRQAEEMLDTVYGILVRSGLHCAPAAHEYLGNQAGTIRVSSGASTTAHELSELTRALRELARIEA